MRERVCSSVVFSLAAFRGVIGNTYLCLRITTENMVNIWTNIIAQPIRYSMNKLTNRIFENRDPSLLTIIANISPNSSNVYGTTILSNINGLTEL